ncbi:hypothetical protein D3C77_198250 [compost metagenome]
MAQAPSGGVIAQGLEACSGHCRFRLNVPDSLQGDIVAWRIKIKVGPDTRATDYFYLVKRDARQVGQIAFQSYFRIGPGDSRRCGDEANLLGLPAEGLDHPAQQQRQFGRLGTHIGVCLVEDDPA